jgi:hypothetical protein
MNALQRRQTVAGCVKGRPNIQGNENLAKSGLPARRRGKVRGKTVSKRAEAMDRR